MGAPTLAPLPGGANAAEGSAGLLSAPGVKPVSLLRDAGQKAR